MVRTLPSLGVVLLLASPSALAGPTAKAEVAAGLDQREERLADVPVRIRDRAEAGYQEAEGSELLAGELEAHGFRVRRGVAGIRAPLGR